MVTHVVRIPLANQDKHLHVEVEDELLETVERHLSHEALPTLPQTLDESIEGLLPGLRVISDKLRELEPAKCTVTVGVKLTATAGAVLANLGGEADFTVALEWDKSDPAGASTTRGGQNS